MKKELYYIGCSGEDSIYTERLLTKKQAEFLEVLVDELQTNREGCWMERVPNKKEIKNILKKYNEWKKGEQIPTIIKLNCFTTEDQLLRRFMYDIFYREQKMQFEVQGYVIHEIGKLIDLYKKL